MFWPCKLPLGIEQFASNKTVRVTLERCPPELSADLVDRGLMLAGGGALLRGLDKLLCEETGLPVHIAEDPLSAVAEGAGKVLQELSFLKHGYGRCGQVVP